MDTENTRIKYYTNLEDSSFDVPEIQEWDVIDGFERHVGTVDDLLVDTKEEVTRYVDVKLDEDVVKTKNEILTNPNIKKVEGDVHMILPIGTVRLDNENKRIISDEINQNIIDRGPLHKGGEDITPDYERGVVGLISEADSGRPREVYISEKGPVTDEFYNRAYFDLDRFYNRR
ncbi:MAG: hypothetical protein ACNS60_17460 [Candidatus Cyclobacteriaceae bacterium M2_1C_046]